MQRELVEKRRWIGQSRFLHALNFCMLLPGPEATQLAIYIGWLLHKTAGGIVAGVLFILPSVVILWALSFVYAAFGHVAWVSAIFYGFKPVVMAIVATAVLRIGKKALKNETRWGMAVAAFVALYFFRAPFPLIILSAALIGLAGSKLWPGKFLSTGHGDTDSNDSVLGDSIDSPQHARPSFKRAIVLLLVFGILWFLPIASVAFWRGGNATLLHEGLFFSKAAVVTFGGAYAVLPYVAQRAVEHFAWLTPGQMMDGLGLAETTPGPLIMVLQFVGFLAAWNHPQNLSPLVAGTLGALLTTWVTFTPCFLWVFLGAPHIEQLRGNVRIHSALSGVTAAVVGVIFNLAVWFALQVIRPHPGTVDYTAIALGAAAFWGMIRWKLDIIPVVICGGIAGILVKAFT